VRVWPPQTKMGARSQPATKPSALQWEMVGSRRAVADMHLAVWQQRLAAVGAAVWFKRAVVSRFVERTTGICQRRRADRGS
jgi:hypothetical protein